MIGHPPSISPSISIHFFHDQLDFPCLFNFCMTPLIVFTMLCLAKLLDSLSYIWLLCLQPSSCSWIPSPAQQLNNWKTATSYSVKYCMVMIDTCLTTNAITQHCDSLSLLTVLFILVLWIALNQSAPHQVWTQFEVTWFGKDFIYTAWSIDPESQLVESCL